MNSILTSIHYIYIIFIILIFLFMILKKDLSIICILGVFTLGFLATNSVSSAISGVFNSFILAISELLGTILIISTITAMGVILDKTGINQTLTSPFKKFMKTPTLAYWTIGILMMIISLFFWPSPAVALIGAILVPSAVKAGLPAIGAAMAMNLFGHGIALSGDFIIQGAPKIIADGASISVNSVISASLPLVLIMGSVTTIVAFILLKKDMKNGHLNKGEDMSIEKATPTGEFENILSKNAKKGFSIFITLMFALDIFLMYKLNLQGGDATALIGGTSITILIILTLYTKGKNASSLVTSYIVDGFLFGFKVFGPVIPIAAFFYLGDSGFITVFGNILPNGSKGIVNDIGSFLANSVPVNSFMSCITVTGVGVLTGLDGSGFSGLALAGSVAKIFGIALGKGVETLTALGQISTIWVGGGTLIPWALLPVAAICKVDPFELAKRNFKPVVIGLIVTTFFAMFII
ncbi:hypothetical protein [Clostridium cochlearium]|uniref:hypothetical protein n=1 Tax=Clostridium cochlearium TaxID=1494 RepID=UPI0017AB12B0|nr:hypothetical protein [Clostridium cochlearium]MCR1970458.1 hypothetical protein [Clostridium cochlearium]NMA58701.1 hypothetical protein [Clostridium cochlearium]